MPASLPLVLAGGLVEYVFLAVDGEDSVLEGALPISASVIRSRVGVFALLCCHSPLVLDALDLVIHAKHDMAHAVVIIVIVVLFIFGIVEV